MISCNLAVKKPVACIFNINPEVEGSRFLREVFNYKQG
jgi:hypothetical protein